MFYLPWNVKSPSHPFPLASRLQRKVVTQWHHCWSPLLKIICMVKYSRILTLSNMRNWQRKVKVYLAVTLLGRRSERRSSTPTRSSFWLMMRSGGFRQAPRSFDFVTNSKLQNLQGQFGGPFNKGLNSDEIKKGGWRATHETWGATWKKYHSVCLGLEQTSLKGRYLSLPDRNRLPVSPQSSKQIRIKSNDSKHQLHVVTTAPYMVKRQQE
jgi:hypothetical protein